jgi:hypothetical protein
LNDREAVTDCGHPALAPRDNRDWSIGENPMRFILALGLLLALSASADAARLHHAKPRHLSFSVRNSHAAIPQFAAPPIRYDDIPSYNDPSKFGGGAP